MSGEKNKKPIEVKLYGYLKSTKLDQHGAKQHNFEFSGKNAVESAKLELMSRDFTSYMPELLEVTVKKASQKVAQSYGKKVEKAGQSKKVYR